MAINLRRISAVLAVGTAALSGTHSAAFAQATETAPPAASQPAPTEAKPAEAPPPAATTAPPAAAPNATPLPDVEVITQEAAPAPKKAPSKKPDAKKSVVVAGQSKSKPASTPSTAVEVMVDPDFVPPDTQPAAAPETATGPIDGYVAKRTATGIKTDTPLKEIPQSVSVVGAQQIRDQGAQNWQEALRYVPGVIADGYGLDSRADTAFVRGTEAAEYLDGLRRTFNYYIFTYKIDPYFMERIEVLRGPPSVLYGQAPVGGIINSVSKRPQEKAHNEVTVEYGTFDFKQVKADLTGPLTDDGKWSYRVIGALRDSDTQVDFVPNNHQALSPSITYRPVAGTNITVLGYFQNDDSGSTVQFLPHVGTRFRSASGFVPSNRFIGEPGFDRYDTDVKSVSLFVDHKIDDVFKLRHNMRYSDIHNVYDSYYPGFFLGVGNENFPYEDPLQRTITRIKSVGDADTSILNTDTNLEAKVATGPIRHTLLGGVDHARFTAKSTFGDALDRTPFDLYNPVYGQPANLGIAQYDDDGNFIGFLDVDEVTATAQPRDNIQQTGIYIQDQMRVANWIAVVGARRDHLRNAQEFSDVQNDEAATYRAGLMYEFDFGATPYVSYAESFVPLVGRKRLGGTFDPQLGEMVEVGFKYQPPGTEFVINSAVYDIQESNRLAGDPTSNNFSIQTGSVSIKGFEIEALGDLSNNLRAIASYSYTDAVYTGGDQKGFRVESVPHHLASLWTIYSWHDGWLDGWSAGAGVRYVGSSLDGADDVETPAVTLFDATIAYETPQWRWSINALNLEDEYYFSTCLARGDCFPAARRTVTTGLTYKF